MTDKPTMRWHTTCCNTPLFNTLPRAKPPFLSVNTSAFDDVATEAALGPRKGQFLAAEAEPAIADPQPYSMLKLAAGFFPRLIKDRLSGDWKKFPLFDPDTLAPIARPRRVSPDERAAARS